MEFSISVSCGNFLSWIVSLNKSLTLFLTDSLDDSKLAMVWMLFWNSILSDRLFYILIPNLDGAESDLFSLSLIMS